MSAMSGGTARRLRGTEYDLQSSDGDGLGLSASAFFRQGGAFAGSLEAAEGEATYDTAFDPSPGPSMLELGTSWGSTRTRAGASPSDEHDRVGGGSPLDVGMAACGCPQPFFRHCERTFAPIPLDLAAALGAVDG